MSLSGVNIEKLNGQLGLQQPLNTGTSALLLYDDGTIAPLAEPLKLLSYDDAKAKEVAFDTPSTSIEFAINEHIKRYFKRTSAPLWVLGHDQSMEEALTPDNGFVDVLLNAAEGDIRQLGVTGKHDFTTADHTSDMGTEMLQDVEDAIAAADALYAWSLERYRPIDIWIEGGGFTGAAAGAVDLRDTGANAFNADHVSVVVAQDKAAVDLLTDNLDNDVLCYADVGTVLGIESATAISEKYGRIPEDDLTIASEGIYTTPMIGGVPVSDYDQAVLIELDNKGYVFPRRYVDVPGVYLEDLPCATPVTSDYYIRPYGRIFNESARRIYQAMVRQSKRKRVLDDNGLLDSASANSLRMAGLAGLEQLAREGQIEGREVTVDRQARRLSNGKWEITIKFAVKVAIYSDVIKGQIGLTL